MRLWLCSLPAVLAALALVFCLSLAVALVCFSPVLPAVEGEEGSPMSLLPFVLEGLQGGKTGNRGSAL